jgi:hypothetical protein
VVNAQADATMDAGEDALKAGEYSVGHHKTGLLPQANRSQWTPEIRNRQHFIQRALGHQ